MAASDTTAPSNGGGYVDTAVSPGDRRAVDAAIAGKRDEETRQLFACVATLPTDKGGKTLRRVCAFFRRSFVVIREGKGKTELAAHYIDLVEMHVGAADVSLKMRAGGVVKLGVRERSEQQALVTTLVRFFLRTFPAAPVPEAPPPFWVAKFGGVPQDMLDAARADYAGVAAAEGGPAPLGSFLRCYTAMCEWLGQRPVAEVCWDAENLLPRLSAERGGYDLDTRLFRREFLKPEDLRPVFHALSFNEHFRSLTLTNWLLPPPASAGIAHMLHHNTTLTRVVLACCSLNRDGAAAICDALVANEHPCLTYLDISGNPFEDKGFAAFGACFPQVRHKLQFLGLANCGAGRVGVSALVDGIANNEVTLLQTLTKLDISGNGCSGEATTAITKLLSKGKLTHLVAQGTALTTDALQSCYPKSLLTLDISGNHMVKPDVARRLGGFFNNSRDLDSLCLRNCAVTADLLSIIWSPDSHLSLLSELDLSDNDLGDEGLLLVLASIKGNAKLRKLDISRCWGKKTKSRPKLIAELVSLSESNAPISSLGLAGGKHPMGNDLLQFLFSLMSNKSITSLDISGHAIKDCAMVLARVVQTNKTLTSLNWDRNGVTAAGLEFLRIALERNATVAIKLPVIDIAAETDRLQGDQERLEAFLESVHALYRTTGNGAKPAEPSAAAAAAVPPPAEAARHSKLRHLRPAGVDTMTACQLFTQLGEFVRTEGEAEMMAGIPETSAAPQQQQH